jgi:hypothetical protein
MGTKARQRSLHNLMIAKRSYRARSLSIIGAIQNRWDRLFSCFFAFSVTCRIFFNVEQSADNRLGLRPERASADMGSANHSKTPAESRAYQAASAVVKASQPNRHVARPSAFSKSNGIPGSSWPKDQRADLTTSSQNLFGTRPFKST